MGALGLGPSLAARPGGRARGFDFGGGVLPPGASLTRAAPAMRTDAAGLLALAAAHAARFDHDPAGAYRGLLIEPQRTNLVPHATAIDQPPWTATKGAVGVAMAVAPTGIAEARLFVPGAGQASAYLRQVAGAATAGQAYAVSAYLKPAGLAQVTLGVAGAFTIDNLTVDLATGSAPPGVTLADAGGGWRRVSIVRTATSSAAALIQLLLPQTGDGAGGVAVYGVQLEEGGEATTPIPTNGAAATRTADGLTLDWGSRGVADGPATLRWRFDDGSVQLLTTHVTGGLATAPALARPWIRGVERI